MKRTIAAGNTLYRANTATTTHVTPAPAPTFTGTFANGDATWRGRPITTAD